MFLLSEIEENIFNRFKDVEVPIKFGGDPVLGEFDEVCEWYNEQVEDLFLNDKIHFRHGVSKAAFIFDDLKYVIKIPFNGKFIYDENEGIILWEQFQFAFEYSDVDDWNYCEAEAGIYDKAVENGFGEFFAATRFYDYTKNNYPVYIQEKVIPFKEVEASMQLPSKKSIETAKKREFNRYCDLDYIWIASAIDYYGEEKTKKFLEYVENNWRIGQDLHSGNIGYALDGRPCLLDFSGWED